MLVGIKVRIVNNFGVQLRIIKRQLGFQYYQLLSITLITKEYIIT